MEITDQTYSYAQLAELSNIENDQYGIAAYQFERRKRAFLANPNLHDHSEDYLFLKCADGVPVGRAYYFPTRLKLGDEFVEALSSSSLEVYKDFRHIAVGADIIVNSSMGNGHDLRLYAGISQMALPMYKKMRFRVFELPQYLLRRKPVTVLFKHLGLRVSLLRPLVSLGNYMANFRERRNARAKHLKHRFKVSRMDKVPGWVDEMVLNDAHPCKEVHDHQWLQWNIDSRFTDNPADFKTFYAIYDTEDRPAGFFVIKEKELEKGVSNGFVMEWGSGDERQLSELEIYRLALTTFSLNVCFVNLATTSEEVAREMKRWGFVGNGKEHILFKDDTRKYKEYEDAGQWRLRLGYADTLLA